MMVKDDGKIKMTCESISIEIDYGSRFQERVLDRNNPDPLVGMKIRIDGIYVLGDENHASKDSMSTNLTVQLEATDQILANGKAVIEYMNGPMWLVLEPHDEESVQITGCATIEGVRDPNKRLSIDKSAIVSKEAWIKELVRTAEEFYTKVVTMNPDLEGHEILQRLQMEITDAKNLFETFEPK